MTGGGRTVGITGATGYLGSVLLSRFALAGWDPVALGRRAPAGGEPWRPYDVTLPVNGQLEGLDALVHCAYDMRARRRDDVWRTNVEGTQRLLQAAEGVVPRVIVLSSMSAYPGTRQVYGRAKLAIEAEALRRGAVVVRPGLVYGPRAAGMAGTLTRLAALPLVPVVSGHQFTVHEQDFASAVLALAAAEGQVDRPVGVAHPEPVPFRRLLEVLGAEHGGPGRLVWVPWRVLYGGLRALEVAPLRLPVRADSLLGLARPAPGVPNLEVLTALGVRLRAFGAAAGS